MYIYIYIFIYYIYIYSNIGELVIMIMAPFLTVLSVALSYSLEIID